MPISTLLSQPCLLIRRSASGDSDDYGNETQAETTVQTVCEIQQQQRVEGGTHEDLSDTRWLLILPASTVLDTGDAVEVGALLPGEGVLPSSDLFPTGSHRYELVGEPWPVIDARTGIEHHVEATVRRTAGSEDTS